jgi:SAM-dependent methyltransferase
MHPAARREPTRFVEFCLPKLPSSGHALDIAAGTGRHSVALARRGLQVDAIDISCQGVQLACRYAAQAGSAAGQLRFIVADVEQNWLPARQYTVILVSYFLWRPLFELIKSRLRPGGWLVYETFTLEQLSKSYHQRPSKPELYLKRDELRQAFLDLNVVFYDEGEHNEKFTAQLLAQKQA